MSQRVIITIVEEEEESSNAGPLAVLVVLSIITLAWALGWL